jgi:cell wall-associated NlpC family hydrolase
MRQGLTFLSFSILLVVIFVGACRQKQKSQPVVQKAPVEEPIRTKTLVENSSELRQKLNVSGKDLKKNKLYSFSEEWYGVPYRYGGCDKNGVDCSCFANLLYQNVYSKSLSRSANDIFKSCDQLSLGELQPGDLLFFKIGGKTISHVAVFLKDSYFIHSSTSKGVILNSLEEAYYKKYFFCAGKLRKV